MNKTNNSLYSCINSNLHSFKSEHRHCFIYPNRVILGVDSRLTYTDNLTGERKYNTGCKLSAVNNVAFAFTGYHGYTGNVAAKYGDFRIEAYVRSILSKKHRSFNETFTELVEGLERELTGQMRTYKRLNVKDYNGYVKSNGRVLSHLQK
jgi:hypothetical protein